MKVNQSPDDLIRIMMKKIFNRVKKKPFIIASYYDKKGCFREFALYIGGIKRLSLRQYYFFSALFRFRIKEAINFLKKGKYSIILKNHKGRIIDCNKNIKKSFLIPTFSKFLKEFFSNY